MIPQVHDPSTATRERSCVSGEGSFTYCKRVASVCWYEFACVLLNICMIVLIQCSMTTIHVLEDCVRLNVLKPLKNLFKCKHKSEYREEQSDQ